MGCYTPVKGEQGQRSRSPVTNSKGAHINTTLFNESLGNVLEKQHLSSYNSAVSKIFYAKNLMGTWIEK